MRAVLSVRAAAVVLLAACREGMPLDEATLQSEGRFLRSAHPVKGQYIVVLKQEGARDAREVGQELGWQYRGEVGRVFRHALRGFVATMDEADARALSADPRVARCTRWGSRRTPPGGLDGSTRRSPTASAKPARATARTTRRCSS